MGYEPKRGKFDDTLRVDVLDDDRSMLVVYRFRYRPSDAIDDSAAVKVPVGFRWNGASIPRFWWRVFGSPFVGIHRLPSVIHDWAWVEAKARRMSFARANWLFWDAMRTRCLEFYGERRCLCRELAYRFELAKCWCKWAAVAVNGWRVDRKLRRAEASP